MPDVARQTAAPKRAPKRNHVRIARQFERDVLDGQFPCGKLFRAAVELYRHNATCPPYVFDAAAGARACRFMELLPYAEGPKRGERFRLEPWQVWIVSALFGWIDPTTGHRRFREASIWLPKGNGKSPLAALIALYIIAVDKTGAKAYSAASMQKQARLVFGHAQEMLRLAPAIRERFRLEVEEHRIKGVGDNRVYEAVSAEAGSIEGIRPAVVVLDELHVLGTRKLFDNVSSAVAKTDDGLLFGISTAGVDAEGIGRERYKRAEEILEGRADEPTTLAVIAGADPDDDPFSELTWQKANPNLGISVSLVGLRAAARRARELPSELPSFLCKHLTRWVDALRAFIDMAAWDRCVDGAMPDFAGEPVTVGLDLATTRDLTARVLVGTKVIDGQRHYFVRGHGYLPERSITLQQIEDLGAWAQAGWLTLAPGPVLDFGIVKNDVLEDVRAHPGSEVCYDPWAAASLANDLTAEGLTMVEVRQGARTQSAPMKELEAATLSGRLHHDGNPVLRMCVANLVARSDRNGNIVPDREDETKKIDLAVALVNALVRAMVIEPPQDGPLVWSAEDYAAEEGLA